MTTSYTRAELLSKIQKMLDLASDVSAGNEHVAAIAAAKAQKMMIEYAITEAELNTHQQPDRKMVTKEVTMLFGKLVRWEDELVQDVAHATFTYVFNRKLAGVYVFCGQELDVELACYMFLQLRTRLERLSRAKLAEHGRQVKTQHGLSIYNAQQCRVWSSCHPTVYRSRWLESWLAGARLTVAIKLSAMRQEVAPTGSAALMVIEDRETKAMDWATEEFKVIPAKKRKAVLRFTNAKAQGQQDGATIDIRKGLPTSDLPQLQEG